MAQRFMHESPYRDQLGESVDTAKAFILSLIDSPIHSVLVYEDKLGSVQGVFALYVFDHYYSGERMAGELIWYVEPEARKGFRALELLRAAEKEAKKAGAKRMQLVAPTEEIGKIYMRCGGYQKIEVTYQRTLQ